MAVQPLTGLTGMKGTAPAGPAAVPAVDDAYGTVTTSISPPSRPVT